jgi:hypothetical protein
MLYRYPILISSMVQFHFYYVYQLKKKFWDRLYCFNFLSTAAALLKIGSINCRELSSDKIKRRDIFLKCRQNYDISFLIDTHSKNETEPYWRSEWGNDITFSYRHQLLLMSYLSFQFYVVDL